MSEETEDITFPSEDIEKIVQETVEAILGPRTYSEKDVPVWINELNEAIMEKLVSAQKPFKFLINSLIMQRKGANVVVSNSNFWDTGLDSSFTVIWPREKPNKAEQSKNTIQCMVSVYAMSLLNSSSLFKNEL